MNGVPEPKADTAGADADRYLVQLNFYFSKMKPLPAAAARAIEICNRMEPSATDLNAVVAVDPVLTARLLKLVNSAYYALPQKVTSVVRAILLLGVNTVKNLVLSAAVMDRLSGSENFPVLDMAAFWEHSLAVGVTAKQMARETAVDRMLVEEYFITGLLHDIGKIPLNVLFADQYASVAGGAEQGVRPLYACEREAFGLDHSDVGKLIAEKWRLGPVVGDVLGYHHAPAGYGGDFHGQMISVSAADFIVHTRMNGGQPAFVDDVGENALNGLGLSTAAVDRIVTLAAGEMDKARVFLDAAG